MFYKFGDNTKTKTVIKNAEDKINGEEEELFNENDNTNRRSAIIKKYIEEESKENSTEE